MLVNTTHPADKGEQNVPQFDLINDLHSTTNLQGKYDSMPCEWAHLKKAKIIRLL